MGFEDLRSSTPAPGGGVRSHVLIEKRLSTVICSVELLCCVPVLALSSVQLGCLVSDSCFLHFWFLLFKLQLKPCEGLNP